MSRKSVPSVPEEGNTKASSVNPAKKWIFVLNNYTNEEYDKICSIVNSDKNITICAIGKETGDNGTPHLQGYLEFDFKKRPMTVFNFTNRIHWGDDRGKPAKGTRERNVEYCSKEKLVFSKGLPKPVKLIENLYPWQQKVLNITLQEPDDRTIHWYYEKTGNVGKSQLCKYLVVKHNALYCCGGEFKDIMNLVFNQDMDKTNTVVFNIPRACRGKVSYRSLEAIKDGMVCNTKYETGVKIFNSPHIICFANFLPDDEEQLSQDRWKITNIDPD